MWFTKPWVTYLILHEDWWRSLLADNPLPSLVVLVWCLDHGITSNQCPVVSHSCLHRDVWSSHQPLHNHWRLLEPFLVLDRGRKTIPLRHSSLAPPINFDVSAPTVWIYGSKNTERITGEYWIDYCFVEFRENLEHAQTVGTRPLFLSRVCTCAWKKAWGRG